MPRIISEKKKAESSDEDHLASAKDIIDYLADYGVD